MPSVSPFWAGRNPVLPAKHLLPFLLAQNSISSAAKRDSFTRQSATTNPVGVNKAGYIPPVLPALKAPGYSSLRIVYNNDPHEKFKALPHLVSAFRLLSQQGEAARWDVLRLNSGDNNVGKEPGEWALNVSLMNLIGYHATTMGNHELDLGSANYANGLSLANFPTVLSNLKFNPQSAIGRAAMKGKIRTQPQILRAGHNTYGLIGITTPDLKKVVSSKAKLEGEEVQSFEDTVANVTNQVKQLQQQGLNKIIVLSHLGRELDQKLAQRVPGIDIIVGGHSHDVIDGIKPGFNYLKTPTGEPVLIVQGGKNGQWMGVADVLFDPQGHVIPQQNTLFSPYDVPPDPQAIALRDEVLGTPRPLATISTAYDANDNEFHSDIVAQFTADAMRAASGADIAFVRSPEIRSNIEPGPLTDQDLNALMPFTDPVIKLSLSGNEILKSLTRSAQGLAQHEPHPGMLHPSGMAITLSQQTGQVQQAYVLNKNTRRWEALNPHKQYSVAIGEFAVTNKEFPEFSHPERITWNSGQSARSFFAWGLQQAKGMNNRPVSFKDDGRLQITNSYSVDR